MIPAKPPRSSQALSTRPIPRSAAPDFEDDGDFEGDDPPTTAEPVRDDHHPQIVPRSPSVPTRPVPKFRAAQTEDAFDDDANPTMIDPHVPTGISPRRSFDPHARIDDNRRTMDLSGAAKRALEPTADLGPAARRALADGNAMPDPRLRDAIPTAPIRKTPIAAGQDPITTAPLGSGAFGDLPSPPIPPSMSSRRESARNPASPTGPMLRPPPDAPPPVSNASGSQRAIAPAMPGSQRPSGPQRAIPPSAPPPFVTDRRAAMAGQQSVELPHTIPEPPYDGAPAPLRAFQPPSQAAPTILQRPAQSFDPHGRIDDSSRTHRWEGRPPATGSSQEPFATPYAVTDPSYSPPPPQMHAISHKPPDNGPRPQYEQGPVPQVQLRSMADLSKTPAQGMGRLAPPHDPNRERARKTQDWMIWGSVVVIIGSIVTLVIWLIAR